MPCRTFVTRQSNSRAGKNWLLIFDNVDHIEVVLPLWPKITSGRILVTSQKSELAEITSSRLVIQPLDREAGGRFLLRCLEHDGLSTSCCDANSKQRRVSISQNEHQDNAELVAAEVSGVPLAIKFVTSAFTRMPLAHVLRELQEYDSFSTIFDQDTAPALSSYEKPLGTAWDKATRHLDALPLLLLRVLAMLSSDGVPETMFLPKEQPADRMIPGIATRAQ